ncbi:MAG: lysophospholipid acyltransferase family protein [Pseudoruegeria sp.]
MSTTWQSEETPSHPPLMWEDWGRVILRGTALGVLTFGCLLLLLIVRLIEKPIYGVHRPWTPHITQFVCRNAFRILGMEYQSVGQQMRHKGAVVANHSSWLDIFSLNAKKRVYFVSKAEVENWPGIGWLARATGTVFIKRDPKEARGQQKIFEERLIAGHKLLFFPEGTSTDGRQVLNFKPTLFQAFFAPALKERLWVQPVTVIYHAPKGADARFYGWWGDMDFATHLLQTLAAKEQGSVEVIYHTPVKVSSFTNRKTLSAYCETTVRQGHQDYMS